MPIRAPQPVRLQELRVVAARRRRASSGRGIVRVGATPSPRAGAESQRPVTVRAIGPAVSWSAVIGMIPCPADPPGRRPDADEHRELRRIHDRAGGVGADVRRPESRGGARARARPARAPARVGRRQLSGRGSGHGSYGFKRESADSAVLAGIGVGAPAPSWRAPVSTVFAMITAPASRRSAAASRHTVA